MADQPPSAWMRITLRLAALYNFSFGLIAIFTPFWLFDITDAVRPNYPELWQCIGMIVGVYGVGYWIASYDPFRHWPIVLVGLLGKVFGPIGFIIALINGVFPLSFGWTIVFNDLIWLAPFSIIVFTALNRVTKLPLGVVGPRDEQQFSAWQEASRSGPLLVVFMRHAGCSFCRQTLAELLSNEGRLREHGLSLVLVHQGTDKESQFSQLFPGKPLPKNWQLLANPNRTLYLHAGIRRTTVRKLLQPSVWQRALVTGLWHRHGVGALEGDGFMMPGALLWQDARLVYQWIPVDPAEQFSVEKVLAELSAAERL